MCLCARNQLGATPVLVSLERLVLSLPISIDTNIKLTCTAIQNRIVESNVKGGGAYRVFSFPVCSHKQYFLFCCWAFSKCDSITYAFVTEVTWL